MAIEKNSAKVITMGLSKDLLKAIMTDLKKPMGTEMD